jgi:hypothetical protein
MEIFLSYARPDQSRADSIAQRLRQAGNNVWLDRDLTGGQSWWDGILRQLRRCDVAVTVVSRASLRSQTCIRERQYAGRLGKPILPLAVEPVGPELLPSDLARLQVIDYCQPDDAAAFRLIGAIRQFPQQSPLPDPLPETPPVPTSPLGPVAEQLSARSLTQDQQLAIIGRLESALDPSADPNDRPIALDLLARLERRTDLLEAVDRRIRTLRASAGTEAPRTPPWTPEPPPWTPEPPSTPGGSGAAGGGQGGGGFSWAGTQSGSGGQQTGGGRQGAGGGRQGAGGGRQDAGGGRQNAGGRPQDAGGGRQDTGGGRQDAGGGRQDAGGVRQQTGGVRQQTAGAADVSPHWVMAIVAAICLFPLGLPAVFYASRARTSLEAGDPARAHKSATIVKIFFWVTVAIWVIVAATRA